MFLRVPKWTTYRDTTKKYISGRNFENLKLCFLFVNVISMCFWHRFSQNWTSWTVNQLAEQIKSLCQPISNKTSECLFDFVNLSPCWIRTRLCIVFWYYLALFGGSKLITVVACEVKSSTYRKLLFNTRSWLSNSPCFSSSKVDLHVSVNFVVILEWMELVSWLGRFLLNLPRVLRKLFVPRNNVKEKRISGE